jgi:hypothetical protein
VTNNHRPAPLPVRLRPTGETAESFVIRLATAKRC